MADVVKQLETFLRKKPTIAPNVYLAHGAVLVGAVIGDRSLIGANALVTQRTKIPAGSLVLGSPAQVVRPLNSEEREQLRVSAEKYAENAAFCLKSGVRVVSGRL